VDALCDLSGRQRRKAVLPYNEWQHHLNDTYEIVFLARQAILTDKLTWLRLSHCKFDAADMRCIIDAASRCVHLRGLDVSGNYVDGKVASCFGTKFKTHPNLEEVDLSQSTAPPWDGEQHEAFTRCVALALGHRRSSHRSCVSLSLCALHFLAYDLLMFCLVLLASFARRFVSLPPYPSLSPLQHEPSMDH